jgi:hypothetical protein
LVLDDALHGSKIDLEQQWLGNEVKSNGKIGPCLLHFLALEGDSPSL